MKTHRDFLQALLVGDVLEIPKTGVALRMNQDGMVTIGDKGATYDALTDYSVFEQKPLSVSIKHKVFNIPVPYRLPPSIGTEYWALSPVEDDDDVSEYTWDNDKTDHLLLGAGLAFKTEEDAENAQLVRRELFSDLIKSLL